MSTKLEQAAQALLAHWDTPFWKDQKHTGDYISALREALVEQTQPTFRFTSVGIVNEQHEINWMEGVTDDISPVGSVLYAKVML